MDARRYERKPVDQKVRFVYGGRVVSTTQVVDMSKGGLAIQTLGLNLTSGQVVGIDFFKPGHPRAISRCISAMVVHVGPKTTGLSFSESTSMNMAQQLHSPMASK